jgi:hypothetical protein
MRRWRRVLARCAPLAAASTLAVPAYASPDYPGALRRTLDLSYDPPCAVCHAAPDGGDGPVTTPFGEALAKRGLLGRNDTASLDAAIARNRKDSVDSDGDGARDLDELAWGGDPNAPDLPADPNAQPPQYGCSVGTGCPAGARGASSSVLAVLATALALSRRCASNPR